MKSKFDGIVKIRKQELNQAEATLLKAREMVENINKNINKIINDILSLQMPQNGTFMQLQQQRQLLNIARNQKNILHNELQNAKQRENHCQRLYEFANKELEKMLYLKEEEINNKIKHIKKQEQKDLDEIALQLFSRKAKG